MERTIAVYIEEKDEKMVPRTHLPPMWAKPPSPIKQTQVHVSLRFHEHLTQPSDSFNQICMSILTSKDQNLN